MNGAVSRDDLVPSPLFYHRLATSSTFRPLIQGTDARRDEDENQIYDPDDAFLRGAIKFQLNAGSRPVVSENS